MQTELAFPFGGEGFDVANQQLEQQARRYETLVPLQRELQNLETDRANIAAFASTQELQNLDEGISKTLQKIEVEQQYLNQIDATAKALLQQQQTYAKYGFIADEVSRALSDSITGLITGTTTVTEAFSRMFENIGKAFIDMATQMLAQQLFMTVLGAFGGGITGGNPAGSGGNVLPGGWQQYAFAEGGFVTGPTRALIGEGGEPEYVIPFSKMDNAMANYANGARGEDVFSALNTTNIPFTRSTEHLVQERSERETIAAINNPKPLDVRFESQVINGVEYVTAEQHRKGMSQAAERGRALALTALQNSVKTRKRVGMA